MYVNNVEKIIVPITDKFLIKLGFLLNLVLICPLLYFYPESITTKIFLFLLFLFTVCCFLLELRISFYFFLFSLFIAPVILNFCPGVSGFIIRELPLILILFLIIIKFLGTATSRIHGVRLSQFEIILLMFFFMMLIQALRQYPIVIGILGFRSVALYMPIYFMVLVLFNSKEKIQKLVTFLIGIALFLALIAIFQYIFTQSLMNILGFKLGDVAYRTSMGHLKASATLGSPFTFAMIIATNFLILLSLYISRNLKTNQIVTIISLFILGLALIFSFSRIIFLSFILVFFLLGFFYKRKIIKYFVIVLLFLVIINVMLDNFLIENLLSSFGIGKNNLGISSTMERVEFIKKGLALVSEKPLFGFGLGVTGAPSRHYADLLEKGYFVTENYYLKLLIESGIVGTTLFVLFFGIAILNGLKLYKKINDGYLKHLSIALTLGLIIIAIINVATSSLELPAFNCFFWLILGLLNACYFADYKINKTTEISFLTKN